jgi:hypothetical protein
MMVTVLIASLFAPETRDRDLTVPENATDRVPVVQYQVGGQK